MMNTNPYQSPEYRGPLCCDWSRAKRIAVGAVAVAIAVLIVFDAIKWRSFAAYHHPSETLWQFFFDWLKW